MSEGTFIPQSHCLHMPKYGSLNPWGASNPRNCASSQIDFHWLWITFNKKKAGKCFIHWLKIKYMQYLKTLGHFTETRIVCSSNKIQFWSSTSLKLPYLTIIYLQKFLKLKIVLQAGNCVSSWKLCLLSWLADMTI